MVDGRHEVELVRGRVEQLQALHGHGVHGVGDRLVQPLTEAGRQPLSLALRRHRQLLNPFVTYYLSEQHSNLFRSK